MISRNFVMMTLSQNLNANYPLNVRKVAVFSFQDGKKELELDSRQKKNVVGTISNCWIRVYDESDLYYDFISSSIFLNYNDTALVILCAEDTEFVTKESIARIINEFAGSSEGDLDFESKKTLQVYLSRIRKEAIVASKSLAKMYSVTTISDRRSRGLLDVEDEYEYARTQLVKKYLKNLILMRLIRENKEEILALINQ